MYDSAMLSSKLYKVGIDKQRPCNLMSSKHMMEVSQ